LTGMDKDQQFRLRRFWGSTIFSLGVLWGVANLIYLPIAALTSIVGSSWLEVGVIFAGGLLTFTGSGAAFFRRSLASFVLLAGGTFLLVLAIAAHVMSARTHGIINLLLLYLAGSVPVSLGVFGAITQRKGWPPLR